MTDIVVEAFGGPEALKVRTRQRPEPGAGQVLIAQSAIGINFVDINHRAGEPYPMELPFVPGIEAVGEVVALGERVSNQWLGKWVGYAGPMPGAYATHAVLGVNDLVGIPDGVAATTAAAVLMQGMTAWYLAHRVTDIERDDYVLVHAAATGVGHHLVAWLSNRGAKVVGTTRRPESLNAIREAGARVALAIDNADDLTEAVSKAVGSEHTLKMVFDSVGGSYTVPSLQTLATKGLYVNYGLAGGMTPAFEIAALSGFFDDGFAGSLRTQWASMGDYLDTIELRQRAADAVFQGIEDDVIHVPAIKPFPLQQAADAHRAMVSSTFDGKVVLTV